MSSSLLETVIFDMDGVLVDSESLIAEAAIAFFRELGHTVAAEDFLPFVGTGEHNYLGGVADKHGVKIDRSKAVARLYEIYLELVPEKLKAFPGAVELVETCRKQGHRTVIASSADRIKIEANMKKIGLPVEDWYAVVSGEDVEKPKPAPDIFLKAAELGKSHPANCIVFEDSVHGVQAANEAGIKCIALAQTFNRKELQTAGARLVLDRISDVRPALLRTMLGTTPPWQPR